MNKLIEEQREEFNQIILDVCDNCYLAGQYAEEAGRDCKDDTTHQKIALSHIKRLFEWHIQSLTQFIDSEIERLNSKKEESYFESGCYGTTDDGWCCVLHKVMTNSFQDQITHLESIKKELV